jgi:hypothetical protein
MTIIFNLVSISIFIISSDTIDRTTCCCVPRRVEDSLEVEKLILLNCENVSFSSGMAQFNDPFGDVILNDKYRVSRTLIAKHSSVFRDLFMTFPHENRFLLDVIDDDVFAIILNHLYNDVAINISYGLKQLSNLFNLIGMYNFDVKPHVNRPPEHCSVSEHNRYVDSITEMIEHPDNTSREFMLYLMENGATRTSGVVNKAIKYNIPFTDEVEKLENIEPVDNQSFNKLMVQWCDHLRNNTVYYINEFYGQKMPKTFILDENMYITEETANLMRETVAMTNKRYTWIEKFVSEYLCEHGTVIRGGDCTIPRDECPP